MEVEYGAAFKRQLKRLARRYRRIKSDIGPVIEALRAGKTPGEQMTGHDYTLYKVRAQNSDSQRGKSGGYRIIYYLKTNTRCILVTIYAKSDQEDIAPDVANRLLSEVEREFELGSQ